MKRASLFACFVRLLLFSYIYAFVLSNLLPVIGLTVTQQHQLTLAYWSMLLDIFCPILNDSIQFTHVFATLCIYGASLEAANAWRI